MITKRKITYAALWSALSLVLSMVFRIGSAVVASRILAPSDFGALAFVYAAAAILDQLSYFGVDSALVQKKELEAGDLDVAWTFEFIRKNMLVLIFLLTTPILEKMINDPRIYWVVPLSCLGMFITSFRNNGIVILRRNFQFRQLFYLDLYPQIVGVVVTVGGLLAFPNIFILVLAQLLSAFSAVLIANWVCEHRPKFLWQWSRLKTLFAFGSCLLGNTIVGMIRNQGVEFALGGYAGSAVLGYYNRGRVLCSNIFSQIEGLVWRVSYPLLSAKHHAEDGIAVTLRSLIALTFFVMPLITVLYAMVSPDLFPWLLTQKWNPAIPFIQLFCIYALVQFLVTSAELSFQAIGRPLLGTIRQAVSAGLFLILIYPCVKLFGAKGVVVAGIAATVLIIPWYIRAVQQHVSAFSLYSVFRWCVPAGFSILALCLTYSAVSRLFTPVLLKLILGGMVAALVYVFCFLLLAYLVARSQLKHILGILPASLKSRLLVGLLRKLGLGATDAF